MSPDNACAAVTNPFPFTVCTANVPTLLFTVANVVAKLPVPLPVTSPVKVIVWSPVFEPLMLDVPVTANAGVDEPESVILLTVVGVIAPRLNVIAGVVVEVATDPEIPFAVTTDTEVTVPVFDVYPLGFVAL